MGTKAGSCALCMHGLPMALRLQLALIPISLDTEDTVSWETEGMSAISGYKGAD